MMSYTCFDTGTIFPRVLGGTFGETVFTSMDVDSTGNIVIGGGSADSDIIQAFGQNSALFPIIAFMEVNTLAFKWAMQFSFTDDYDYVASIKFNPNGNYIALTFDYTRMLDSRIIILNSANGSIYSSYKGGGGIFHTDSLIFDSSDNLYVAC